MRPNRSGQTVLRDARMKVPPKVLLAALLTSWCALVLIVDLALALGHRLNLQIGQDWRQR